METNKRTTLQKLKLFPYAGRCYFSPFAMCCMACDKMAAHDKHESYESWTCVCSAVTVHWTPTESDLAAPRSTTLVSLEHCRWSRVWVWERMKGTGKSISFSLNWVMVLFMLVKKNSLPSCHLFLTVCHYLFKQQSVAKAQFLLSNDNRSVVFLCLVLKL